VAWGTGGHTDEFVRFADPHTVLLAWPDADEAARHPVSRLNLQRMQRNFAVLSRATDVQGRPLRVLKLPLPRVVERKVFLSASADTACPASGRPSPSRPETGRRQGDWVMQVAPSSYLNYVVANDLVLLPDYRARHAAGAAGPGPAVWRPPSRAASCASSTPSAPTGWAVAHTAPPCRSRAAADGPCRQAAWRCLHRDLRQRLLQVGHGAVHVVQLLQPEQADAEGLEVGAFVALQRHAGGGLQAQRDEALGAGQAGVVV
jgi:hypothetical protein